MTRFSLLPLAALLGAALAPTIAHADAVSDARKSIQAAYDKRDAALSHFQIENYMAFYGQNYKDVSAPAKAGSFDKQRLATINLYQRAERVTRRDTVKDVIPYHDGVTVTVDALTNITTKNAATGKMQHRAIRETDRAFWVHTPQGWHIKQERTIAPPTPNGRVTRR